MESTNSIVAWTDTMVRERPSVLLYRDYWSNRRCLRRNMQNEGLGWVNPDKYTIDVPSINEISVESKEDGSVTIRELNGISIFTGLINPLDFINQYEPYNILIRQRGYGRAGLLSQTPQEWYRIGAYLDKKIGGEPAKIDPPFEVKEDLVRCMRSDLKKPSFWNPLVSYPSSYILLWLINKYIYNYIFEVLIPWLKPIHMPFLILNYLGLTIAFISRILEEMGTDVMKTFQNILLYVGEKADTKHYRYEEDIPSWLESKAYWVFRSLYLWRGELKIKTGFPPIRFEPDWERIDVWIDARTGIVEWIVTDYHWRELWYKVEKEVNRIYVWIVPNFHTIMPLNLKLEKDQRLKDLYDRDHPVNIRWRNHLRNITGAPEFEGESDRPRWLKRLGFIKKQVTEEEWTPKRKRLFHMLLPERITKYFATPSETAIVTSSLAKLWWSYWRYPLGANNEKYKHDNSPDLISVNAEQPPIRERNYDHF